MSIYKPANFNNLDIFFNDVTHSLIKATLTYEYFIINPLLRNVVAFAARFLKSVWPFYDIAK